MYGSGRALRYDSVEGRLIRVREAQMTSKGVGRWI
jgi:hypothetical protein